MGIGFVAQMLSRNALEALREHGIRYRVYRGELFIDARDWHKYMKLCDEGKLPREIC